MSISGKIQSLITAANNVTGKNRTDLTACVQDLKDGYYALRSEIPDTYTQIFALRFATSKKYINTGVYAKEGTEAEYRVRAAVAKQYGPHLLSGTNYYYPFFRGTSASGSSQYKYSTNVNGSQSNEFLTQNKYTIPLTFKSDYAHNKFTVNGDEYAINPPDTYSQDTTPLYIGNYGGGPDDTLSLEGYFEYCKIWQDGTLIRDYVPVRRNSDQANGVYDCVNNTFTTISGTGTNPEAVMF